MFYKYLTGLIFFTMIVALDSNCGANKPTLGGGGAGSGFGSAVSLNSTTTDQVTIAYSGGLNFGTNQSVTVEAFVQPTAIGTRQSIFKDSLGFELYISTTGALSTNAPDFNCAGATVPGPSGGTLVAGTKYHVATTFSNSGGAIQIFLNGIKIPNIATFTFGAVCSSTSGIMGSAFTGTIDELRVSTNLRYTATFIAPASPFSPDQGTMALFHFNGTATTGPADYASLGATTYTFGGSPSFVTSPFP